MLCVSKVYSTVTEFKIWLFQWATKSANSSGCPRHHGMQRCKYLILACTYWHYSMCMQLRTLGTVTYFGNSYVLWEQLGTLGTFHNVFETSILLPGHRIQI